MNDEFICLSPCRVTLRPSSPSNAEVKITAEKDGYWGVSKYVQPRFSAVDKYQQYLSILLDPMPGNPSPEPSKVSLQAPVPPGGGVAAGRGSRFAVVIGISKYRDSRIPPLRYAARDARAFHDWLLSETGGGYAPADVRLLLDEEATYRNMKSALYAWLQRALSEDVVTIYFAGHGSPEAPDAPRNLFLLPYDVVYDSIPATGFPMWDIETALKRFIQARKVVVIADACHAGGVGQPFDVGSRAGIRGPANPIATGFQNLAAVGDGICVISASDEAQLSREGANWGGGHGVFTFYLLSGLRGEADYNRDGDVTLGELIPYLSEQVRRATGNEQSPVVAGKFDPALSMGR